jgi:pantoate--beta-alanine ligase
MKILRSPQAITAWSERLRREGVTIGFVPTMGALHDGHRALIRTARLASDALVVSVFVNPAQFGAREDFTRYPRPLKQDLALCRSEGVDIVFTPSVQTMYPRGFQTCVTVPDLAKRWEGAIRPHHFPGVATVVTKLLSLVRPDLAVFGQKDYQQALIVQRLVEDLNLGTVIRIHPTVREADGLALSSRNLYLTPAQRRAAPVLFRALKAGAQAIRRGTSRGRTIARIMAETVRKEPLTRLDYVAVCAPETLEPVSRVTTRVVLLGAMKIGKVRLIDNLLVSPPRHR